MSRVARSAPIAHNPADHDAMAAEIAALRAENAALKAKGSGQVTIKPGKSGGLSVYGLQRYPITLYAPQWRRLIAGHGPKILAYIDNEANYAATWFEGCGKLRRQDAAADGNG